MANASSLLILLCFAQLMVAKVILREEPAKLSDQVMQLGTSDSDIRDSSRSSIDVPVPTTDAKVGSLMAELPVNSDGSQDVKDKETISGRMNLDIGSSVSTAYGNGGASTSSAHGYAYKLGLLSADGHYTSLHQSSSLGGYSSNFGQYSPWTTANVNLKGQKLYGSNATASGSFAGGTGYTQSSAQSITTATKLSNGMTLLSNLADPEKKEASDR